MSSRVRFLRLRAASHRGQMLLIVYRPWGGAAEVSIWWPTVRSCTHDGATGGSSVIECGELRQAREWTQEQLAESSGLDRSYIAGIETGARNASLDVIVKLASGLGVTPAELFEGMA